MPGDLKSNPQVLVAALLREAREQVAPIQWLRQLQRQYFTQWKDGDEFAATVSVEGSTTAWLREIPANIGGQLCELALQQLEAEQAAAADGVDQVPPGNVRGFDFSTAPSILG